MGRRKIIRPVRHPPEGAFFEGVITLERAAREKEEVLKRRFSKRRVARIIDLPQRPLSDEERKIRDDQYVRGLVARYSSGNPYLSRGLYMMPKDVARERERVLAREFPD